jgi:AraC-like DNA-binding protein
VIENLESVFYFAALSICSFCLVLLLLSRQHIKRFPLMLSLLIVLFSVGFVVQILMQSSQFYWKHLWMFLAIMHSFIVGPMLWLYAKQAQGENISLRTLDKTKVGIMVLAGLLASPLLFLISNDTYWNGGNRVNSPWFWQIYYALATGYVVLYFVQAAWYLQLGVGFLTKDQPQKVNIALGSLFDRSAKEDIKLQVLRIILKGYLAIIIINAARVVHCGFFGVIPLASQLQSFLDITVTVFVLLLVITKMISSALQQQTEATSTFDPLQKLAVKYQHSALDESNRLSIKSKLEKVLNNPEILTDNSLTLVKLAKIVGERHHYVSQVINQDMHSSFFEMLNQARVTYAQKLMQQKPKLSVVELAEMAGFNSKTTFYTAFNKHVGTTPAKFKNGLITI